MPFATLHTHGPVSIVTLQRPERLNAVGSRLLADLHGAMAAAQADPATRVIVFTGAGRAFCAGDDLKEFSQQAASLETMRQMGEQVQQITRDIMAGPKLVIGALHGHAVGAGLEWALNCDLSVAADNLLAFFPELSLGHFVTGGVTHLLPQAVGYQKAMELLVLGERLDATTLLQLGLVNRVVPLAGLMDTTLALARQVAERSPLATAQLKRVLHGGPSGPLERALALECEAALTCFADPDTARRIAHKVQSR